MNEMYDNMLKLNMDGIVFYSIGKSPYDEDFHCEYTIDEFKSVQNYPRKNWAYYKKLSFGRAFYNSRGNSIIHREVSVSVDNDIEEDKKIVEKYTKNITKEESKLIKFMLSRCEDWLYDYYDHDIADGLYKKFEEESE